MPVTNKKQIERMVKLCGATLPKKFLHILNKYEDNPEALRDAGVAYAMVRKLGQIGENKTYIVFFFSAFSCVVTLPYLLLAYEPMTWKQLLILVMAGLSAAGGQFGITSAYCYAPAKDISVYDYTQILFAAGLGFLLFAQIPDWMSLAGYLIIITMGVLMFLYQRRDGEKEKSA